MTGPCGEPFVCRWCGDGTYNATLECRDCNIDRLLNEMLCSSCKRMRYTLEPGVGLEIAAYLWGERCECAEPRPPSVWDVEHPAEAT